MRLLAIVEENSININNSSNDNNDNNSNNLCRMFAMNLAGNLVTIQVHNSFFLPIELKKMFHDEKVNFIPLHLKDTFVNGKFILILYIYLVDSKWF